MTQTWKQRAQDVILAVMRGALADAVSREEMLRRVDSSYPFGERKYYPYRAWLEVRRALLFESAEPYKPVPNRAQHPSEARKMRTAGYIDMFEQEDASE